MPGQGRAAPLDRLDTAGPVAGGRRGGELDPADGGCLQHRQIGGVEPLQLELEQAAEVVRDFAGVAALAGRELPAPGRRPQDAGVGPGLGELDDEQRHPVGAPVHQPGQLFPDVGPCQPPTQHRGHRLGAELAEPELGDQPPEPELGADVADRGAAGEGIGGTVGAGHQQPRRRGPPGQPGQEVDGRGVGPVEVFEDQHQRAGRGDGLKCLRRLPEHPLGRTAQRPPLQVGATAGVDQRRHLHQPGRRQPGQRGQRLTVVPAQPVQRVEHRQVRLGRAPLLETLPPGDPPGPPPPDLAGERLHQGRLPDPWLAGDQHHLPPPLPGELVQLAQPFQLRLPPDRGDPAQCRSRGVRRLDLLLDGGEELVAAAVDGADHRLLPAAVPDCPARRLDPAGQGRVGDEAAAPDLVEQLGPWHDPVVVPDQVGQDLEDLGLQVAGDAAPAQLVAALAFAGELASRGTLRERQTAIIPAVAPASAPNRR